MGREPLPNGYIVDTADNCTFGTDALLLSAFAAVAPHERVCDLGTGCGILLLLCPKTVKGDGVEGFPAAAALARHNMEQNGLSHRFTIYEQDWKDPLPLTAGGYDRVLCNPPYFPETAGKISTDPARRMARHERGDTLGAVTRAAAKLLKNGGRFILCHRPERLADVLAVLREQGLEPKRIQFVHHGGDSEPFLWLCEAVKGGRPSLRVLPPLIVKERET